MRIALRPSHDEHALSTAAEGTHQEAQQPCCDRCHRLPLIGERIALYADRTVRCELCAALHREAPVSEDLVRHAPDGPGSRVRVIRRLPV